MKTGILKKIYTAVTIIIVVVAYFRSFLFWRDMFTDVKTTYVETIQLTQIGKIGNASCTATTTCLTLSSNSDFNIWSQQYTSCFAQRNYAAPRKCGRRCCKTSHTKYAAIIFITNFVLIALSGYTCDKVRVMLRTATRKTEINGNILQNSPQIRQNILLSNNIGFRWLKRLTATGNVVQHMIISVVLIIIKIEVARTLFCRKKYLRENKFPSNPTHVHTLYTVAIVTSTVLEKDSTSMLSSVRSMVVPIPIMLKISYYV